MQPFYKYHLSSHIMESKRLTISNRRQRKELSHQKLIAEVIQQLTARFLPDINMVKKRIESLIEREYLERVDDAERPAYRYMA